MTRHLPAALKRKCPTIWTKPGAASSDRLHGAKSNGDLIDRGNVNETGLLVCAARMNKIIEWDQ